MISVHLMCGHSYQTGYLTQIEQLTNVTWCPQCRKDRIIISAFNLEHPTPYTQRWIERQQIFPKRIKLVA